MGLDGGEPAGGAPWGSISAGLAGGADAPGRLEFGSFLLGDRVPEESSSSDETAGGREMEWSFGVAESTPAVCFDVLDAVSSGWVGCLLPAWGSRSQQPAISSTPT